MTIKYSDSKRIVATSADVEISGTVTTSGSDTIITFTGDGTFTPTSAFNVEYLVVAGGGGGGGAYQSPGGAGGGGGGYKTNVGGTALGVTAQSYSINVGAGGSAGVADTPIGASYIQAGNGGDSSIVPTSGTSIISTGGGSGGVYNNVAGGNGGSGGGGSYGSTVGTGISGQGYAGGAGSTGTSQNAGSGGGAGGLGNNGSGTNNVISAVGGIGISSTIFDGTTDWYSGGGGAGQGYNGNTANSSIRAVGGSGVGGSGGRNVSPDRYGLNGTSNTGGGGGGGGSGGFTESNGGAGGSGIVIIKFATSGNTYDVDIGGKPTNVQDNSILVEKDTGKRYWGSNSTVKVSDIEDKTLVANGSGIGYSGAYIDINIPNFASYTGDYRLRTLDTTITTTDFVLDFDWWRQGSNNPPNTSAGLVLRSSQSGLSIENSGITSDDYIRTNANDAGTTLEFLWHSAGTSTETSIGTIAVGSIQAWKYMRLTRTDATTLKFEQFSSEARTGSATLTVNYTSLPSSWGLGLKYIGGYCSDANAGGGLHERLQNIDLSSTSNGTLTTWTCMGSTSSSEVSSASNVFLWLDAQDTCSITKDSSGKVSAWVNKIDDTDTLVQTTASKQPIYEPNGKSTGLPAVHFDGVDDFMELPAFTSGEATQPNQYFVVYKLVSTSSVTIFSGGNNALGVNLLQDSSNNFNVHAGSSGIDGAITKDVFVLGTYLFNGSSSTVRKNGSQQGATVSAGTQGENGFTLGSARDGLGRITDIQVCEVIGISNSSSTDRDNIESYLNTKWSVY